MPYSVRNCPACRAQESQADAATGLAAGHGVARFGLIDRMRRLQWQN